MEYITKDDAKLLITLLNAQSYTLSNAKVYLDMRDRLQLYIDNPDATQIEIVNVGKAVVVDPVLASPMI